MKTIKPRTIDMRSLKLSPEEGFVLSRVDGPVSVKDLVALTALDEARIVAIVETLADQGALDVEGRAAPAPKPVVSAGGSGFGVVSLDASTNRDATKLDELVEDDHDVPVLGEEHIVHDDDVEASDALDAPDAETSSELAAAEAEGEITDPGDVTGADKEADGSPEGPQRNERLYRQIYETVFHPMDRDARIAKAPHLDGAELLALCLDPDPVIIGAIFTNPKAGLEHARMVAFHHRTQAGLEHVGKRNDYLSDAQVQRRLLRNPQLPDALLRRIVSPKQLIDTYKIAVDREIPERSRVKTRELLRKKFMLASADERAALLFKTEGRCLILLIGCGLDAHTAQIICSKSINAVLFVQNLARFSATPPQVLVHLLKQAVVRRNQGLRKMIFQHPNLPAEAKRNFGQ